MGHSAKITRGGNKKRVNQKRQEAKLKAQGAKEHTTSIKDLVDAKRALKERNKSLTAELKALNKNADNVMSQKQSHIVRMVPKMPTNKTSK